MGPAVPPAAATTLVPSAEQAMAVQALVGALVGVHVWPMALNKSSDEQSTQAKIDGFMRVFYTA
jgi:hypothetical protein